MPGAVLDFRYELLGHARLLEQVFPSCAASCGRSCTAAIASPGALGSSTVVPVDKLFTATVQGDWTRLRGGANGGCSNRVDGSHESSGCCRDFQPRASMRKSKTQTNTAGRCFKIASEPPSRDRFSKQSGSGGFAPDFDSTSIFSADSCINRAYGVRSTRGSGRASFIRCESHRTSDGASESAFSNQQSR
jgi:hypothetical protein